MAVDGHGLQSEPGVPFSIHVDTSDSHQLGAGASLTVLFLPDSRLGRESQSQRLQPTSIQLEFPNVCGRQLSQMAPQASCTCPV